MQQAEPLGFQRGAQIAYPGDVSARPAEASDEAMSNGIAPEGGDDWNCRRRSLGGQRGRVAAGRSKHGHRPVNEFRRLRRQPVILTERLAIFDHYVLTLDEAAFGQAPTERGQQMRALIGRPRAEVPDHRQRRLLRVRDERPSCGRTA